MIRASIYVLAAGIVWFAEGFVFGQMLGFAIWQVVSMAVVYLGLFLGSAALLKRTLESGESPSRLSEWRFLSLAPMFVLVVGSFVSLPVLLLILAAGKI